MARIELERVSKVYGNDVLAVNDVSLAIDDGEFIVLVGPSGCGKSTLLRMVAGLEEVTYGTMVIDGRDITDLAPRHRDIAMVFQGYALYPHMTVRQNLGYGLKVRRAPKVEARRRIDDVASLLGLGQLLDRKPAQLSGGQRQRVAMGRAIVREPQAFLMDEPLSNLDAKLRVGMRASLAELHARLGVTTVYVTHDQTEAMTLGQRVAVMRDGCIVQVDEPQALYARPRDLFVAAFIGSPSMNLVETVFDGESVRLGTHVLPLEPDERPAVREGRVVLGIRPEAFEHGPAAPSSLPRLDVRADVVEELGADTNVCFRVEARAPALDAGSEDDETSLLATESMLVTARVDPRTRVAQGHSIELAVDPSRFHFFDPHTGAAVQRRGEQAEPAAPAGAARAEEWS